MTVGVRGKSLELDIVRLSRSFKEDGKVGVVAPDFDLFLKKSDIDLDLYLEAASDDLVSVELSILGLVFLRVLRGTVL